METKIRKSRNTRQRQIILEELAKVKTHPTAAELYEIVRKKIPNVSLGTVYRNLEFLSERGNILKLDIAGKQRRYDGCISTHYHVRCKKCDKVADISLDSEIQSDFKKIEDKTGFKIDGHTLEFTGLCRNCKQNK